MKKLVFALLIGLSAVTPVEAHPNHFGQNASYLQGAIEHQWLEIAHNLKRGGANETCLRAAYNGYRLAEAQKYVDIGTPEYAEWQKVTSNNTKFLDLMISTGTCYK